MKTFTKPNSTARRLIRLPETTRAVGACDMTLRRMEKAGIFPRRFKINPDSGPFGAVAHDYDEVQEYIEKRRASRETETEAVDA